MSWLKDCRIRGQQQVNNSRRKERVYGAFCLAPNSGQLATPITVFSPDRVEVRISLAVTRSAPVGDAELIMDIVLRRFGARCDFQMLDSRVTSPNRSKPCPIGIAHRRIAGERYRLSKKC